jgi:uncharacterized protein (TIGR03663 family)
MKGWAAAFFLALLAALALRLPELDRRPMHNDEGVNAVKFSQLWEHGDYRYDPAEFHGPTLHYLTAAVCRLTGAPDYAHLSESRLRLLTALAGAALLLPLLLVRDGLGRGAVAWAACFTALSPALVFYSRYWIHEPLLILFTFLLLAAGWRFLRRPGWGWAALAGAALGLMHATKETFVFVLAAAAGAFVLDLLATGLMRRLRGENGLTAFQPPERRGWLFAHLAAAIAAWLVVWAALFSSFGSNWGGLADSFRTYATWWEATGEQSPHAHAWDFYLEHLFWFKAARGPVWSEGLMLALAVIGATEGFRRDTRTGADGGLVRFLGFYTVLLAAIYSVIPYKTPWCALGFLHGCLLLAGVGAATLWQAASKPTLRVVLAVLLAAEAGHLGWQAWRASFPLCASRSNPWVYAQTSPDLLNLVEEVQTVARAEEGNDTFIQVIAEGGDYWPLPWYLREFRRVGWWADGSVEAVAPVVICSATLKPMFRSPTSHVAAGYFELRPGVFLELHVERGLWERVVKRSNH